MVIHDVCVKYFYINNTSKLKFFLFAFLVGRKRGDLENSHREICKFVKRICTELELLLMFSVDMDLDDDTEGAHEKRKQGEGITLPPFGLATYKMQGNLWVSGHCGRDQERLVSLLSVADSWLKQLRVQHHDFNYFAGVRHG